MSSYSNSTLNLQSGAEDIDRRLAEHSRHSPDTFGELNERYLDLVYRFCLRRVDSEQIAEDLKATVFERAYSRITTFRGDSFRAWLFRVAHNAVTDHYRRRRNVVSWQSDLAAPPEQRSQFDVGSICGA